MWSQSCSFNSYPSLDPSLSFAEPDYSMTKDELAKIRRLSLHIANWLHDQYFLAFQRSAHFDQVTRARQDASRGAMGDLHSSTLGRGGPEALHPSGREKHILTSAERESTEFSESACKSSADRKQSVGAGMGQAARERREQSFDPRAHCLAVHWVKKKPEGEDKVKKKLINFPKDKCELFIGRAVTNDLYIKDVSLSRTHCRIQWDSPSGSSTGGGACVLYDLGSTYGTTVNDEHIRCRRLELGMTSRSTFKIRVRRVRRVTLSETTSLNISVTEYSYIYMYIYIQATRSDVAKTL